MLSFNVELVKSARECFDRQILVRLYDTDAQVFAGKKHLLSVFSSLSWQPRCISSVDEL